MVERIGQNSSVRRRKMYFREWREHRGLTQEQLAERMETTKSSISKIERENRYDNNSLEAMAYALNCDPVDFFRQPPREGEVDPAFLLKKASPQDRQRAAAVIEALLKKTG